MVPFQTKIFPSVPWSRMKQSSVLRAAWEKGFSSATRETAMVPAPLETCSNTAGSWDKAPSVPLQLHGDSPKLREWKGNKFECIGCFRHYCFSNRIPLTRQQYDKNITLTLRISSNSSKADTAGTKERLIQNGKYPWCTSSQQIFSKANQPHSRTRGDSLDNCEWASPYQVGLIVWVLTNGWRSTLQTILVDIHYIITRDCCREDSSQKVLDILLHLH